MKFFISILTTALFSFILGLFTPWWSLAVVAFGIAFLMRQTPLSSFVSGFLGIFALWITLALLINAANGSILANRIGGLLGIGESPTLLAFISALLGGLVAGFAALSAAYLRGQQPEPGRGRGRSNQPNGAKSLKA